MRALIGVVVNETWKKFCKFSAKNCHSLFFTKEPVAPLLPIITNCYSQQNTIWNNLPGLAIIVTSYNIQCVTSLDARSSAIQVSVKSGGLKLIQIQDNGCGIQVVADICCLVVN